VRVKRKVVPSANGWLD